MVDGKSYWAIPTWKIFHGIAEKIDETYYNQNYKFVFGIIKYICNNLPCPYCRKEASFIIDRVKVDSVNTKERFKNYMFNFHNIVNQKLRKKVFSKEYLKNYEKVNIGQDILLFDKRFFRKYGGIRMFTQHITQNNVQKVLRRHFNTLYPHLKK
tara:strand:+ start:3041 stop:3502 length:462 start_codon:yes stop_codon:yes gene_type:complete